MPAFYRLDAPAAAIARALGCAAGNDPWAGGVVAPGQFAPVVTAGREFVAGAREGRGARRMVPRHWGVPPPPSVADSGRAVLTVRNPESPFWIGNLRNSEFRCLVPATAFAEWGDGIDTEGRRLRHLLRATDGSLMAMAGVWKDSEVPTFALLTCPAPPALRHLGVPRVPVIVAPDDRDCWLHGGWKQAGLLVASPGDDVLAVLE